MEISINESKYLELNQDYIKLKVDKMIQEINNGNKTFLSKEYRIPLYRIDDVDLGFCYCTLDGIKEKILPDTVYETIRNYISHIISSIHKRKECENPYIIDAYYTTPFLRQVLYCIREIPKSGTKTIEESLYLEKQALALDSIRILLRREVICAKNGMLYNMLIDKINSVDFKIEEESDEVRYNRMLNRYSEITVTKKEED